LPIIALQILAASILKLKEIAKEIPRAVGDDDHVRCGDALQPGGKVRCLADGSEGSGKAPSGRAAVR
jgi:hypothetical protein